jgi:hypothetical protein
MRILDLADLHQPWPFAPVGRRGETLDVLVTQAKRDDRPQGDQDRKHDHPWDHVTRGQVNGDATSVINSSFHVKNPPYFVYVPVRRT